MTEDTLSGAAAKPGMHDLTDVSSLVAIQPEATVSRTVLQAEGARVVLFSFDAGQVLTEHTAAVPALLQVLDGHLRISADAAPSTCIPGGSSILSRDCRTPLRQWSPHGFSSPCSTRAARPETGWRRTHGHRHKGSRTSG